MTLLDWYDSTGVTISNWVTEGREMRRLGSDRVIRHDANLAWHTLLGACRLRIRHGCLVPNPLQPSEPDEPMQVSMLGIGRNWMSRTLPPRMDATDAVTIFDTFLAAHPPTLQVFRRRSKLRDSLELTLEERPLGDWRMTITDDADPGLNQQWEFPRHTPRESILDIAVQYASGIVRGGRS